MPFVAPLAAGKDARQIFDRVPDVDVADVQRGQAEADDVGRAEVADDAARDQRLADFVGVGVAEADLCPAVRARTGDADLGTAFFDEVDHQIAQCARLRRRRGHVDPVEGRDSARQRRHPEDSRRAAEHPGHAGSGAEAALKRERRGMGEPAGDRLGKDVVVAARDEGEGGGSRAAVEKLVTAADAQVGVRGVQLDRDRPGAVAQVPARERPRRMRRRGQRRHVVDRTAAIVGLRQQQQRDMLVERGGEVGRRDDAEFDPGQRGKPLQHIDVGREIARLGDDHAAAGTQAQRGGGELEDVDRHRIGDDHLVAVRADQPRDFRPDRCGRVDPAGIVPAADQPLAPFVRYRIGNARRRAAGQGTQ
jgi:hypothetical protein